MSISVQHTVWCDRCPKWEMMSGSARYVLQELKRMKWRRIKEDGQMKDLCPACAEKASKEKVS